MNDSAEETQWRVVYLRDGKEVLTMPESNEGATHRAALLDRLGYQVGSVMDAESARKYMWDKYGHGKFQVRYQHQPPYHRHTDEMSWTEAHKRMREILETLGADAEPEIVPTAEVPEDRPQVLTVIDGDGESAEERPALDPGDEAHLRVQAVEFTLQLYKQAQYEGDAKSLVKDARIIAEFLKG